MTTRINSGGPSTGVASTLTADRVTPAPSRPFKQVVQAGASAVVNGAEAAVSKLPGGPLLAAAVRPGAIAGSAADAGVGATRPEGSTGTAGAGAGSPGSGEPGMEDMLARNADQNLYYLELQERISAESRAYTALSNVLKARHDTVKNAIGNIR
jgi:hypothetical protein